MSVICQYFSIILECILLKIRNLLKLLCRMSVNFEIFYNVYLNMFMQTGISEENMRDEGFFWRFFALFSLFIRKFATSI